MKSLSSLVVSVLLLLCGTFQISAQNHTRPYEIVDIPAIAPGGTDNFFNELSQEVQRKFPYQGIESIHIKYKVDRNGKVYDIEPVEGEKDSFDKSRDDFNQYLTIIKSYIENSGRWQPAYKNKKRVAYLAYATILLTTDNDRVSEMESYLCAEMDLPIYSVDDHNSIAGTSLGDRSADAKRGMAKVRDAASSTRPKNTAKVKPAYNSVKVNRRVQPDYKMACNDPRYSNIINISDIYSWGYTNEFGDTVISARYREVTDFHDGIAAVNDGRQWIFIDKDGKKTIPNQYHQVDIGGFSEGLCAVIPVDSENNKYGYIDESGEMMIEPTFVNAKPFGNGLAPVKLNSYGKWGYINTEGVMVITPQFDKAESFSDGRAAVVSDGKWGFINTSGKMVINPEYDLVMPFSEGLAAVRKDWKWGYINRLGVLVIPCKFDDANKFRNSAAVVKMGDASYYIGKDGNKLIL